MTIKIKISPPFKSPSNQNKQKESLPANRNFNEFILFSFFTQFNKVFIMNCNQSNLKDDKLTSFLQKDGHYKKREEELNKNYILKAQIAKFTDLTDIIKKSIFFNAGILRDSSKYQRPE